VATLGASAQCYSVDTTAYMPDSLVAGTIMSKIDDHYSPPVELPFSFCFFGNDVDSLIIGSNGVLKFNSHDTTCIWPINVAIPSPSAPLNAIFLPWQDLWPTGGGTISYATYGTAPFRRFVVSFYQVPLYQCYTDLFTGQVKLYETTNTIEFHLQNKDMCAQWNGGHAILGAQNVSGTAAAVVPGCNYPTQWTATNQAWALQSTGNCCNATIGVPELNAGALNLQAYPSPAYDVLDVTFHAPGTTRCSVQLVDMAGRVVRESKASEETTRHFDLKGVAAGLYFVRLKDADGAALAVKKVMVD
jgi:hypothetical protein